VIGIILLVFRTYQWSSSLQAVTTSALEPEGTHNLDTRQINNIYLPQANLTTYQKGAHYSEIKFFNNLPFEIKNVAGNKKNKIFWKNFYTLIHFTQWKSTLVNRELSTVSQDLCYSGILI
jgi:hypothetical protein